MELEKELLKEKIDKLPQLDRIEYQNKKISILNFFYFGQTVVITVMLFSLVPLLLGFLSAGDFSKVIPLMLSALAIYILGRYIDSKVRAGVDEHEEELDDWLRERIK